MEHTDGHPGPPSWTLLTSPLDPPGIPPLLARIADRHGLHLTPTHGDTVHLAQGSGEPVASVHWRQAPPGPASTLGYQVPAGPRAQILLTIEPGADGGVTGGLVAALEAALLPYSQAELDTITESMPLVRRFATPDQALDGWALVFRDHYLEHSVGFVLGMHRSGIPAEWIFTLAKGDKTRNRHRIDATFRSLGFRSAVLDNAAINDPDSHRNTLAAVLAELDAFIDAAHAAGRRVLVVDDGGLLASGYGAAGAPRQVDAAIELTVSGLKRITAAGPLAVPVLNLARSTVKTLLGYPEIADSCLRRLRTLLPAHKVIGRPITLLGYGTLGSRLAHGLRCLGARVSIVDTDIRALVAAAEAGYPTRRTLAEAITADPPFLLAATTGEVALSQTDLPLLPDGLFLAPFATRDFSLLTSGDLADQAVQIPGLGVRYPLPGDRHVILLGDGRSMNLFEADSIPNQGYDAYRAGTIIAAKALCARPDGFRAGVHVTPADEAIAAAGLFETYYRHYLAPGEAVPTVRRTATRPGLTGSVGRRLRTCVIGYGVAGRLHADILAELGAAVTVIDPKHQDLPKTHRTFTCQVQHLPAAVAADIDIWSICAPTHEHLPVLRAILAHQPRARILLEKPACRSDEVDEFAALLDRHPLARIVVNDQYRHATTLPALTDLVARFEPGQPLTHLAVAFTKDRTPDIDRGRFVDRAYGVLGYEWLHMLAALRSVLPDEDYRTYLNSRPSAADLWATYDPRLFVSALTERTCLRPGSTEALQLELASSVLGPRILLDRGPATTSGPWRHGLRPDDDRHRHLVLHAGRTRFTLHLDPVTAHGGWQLDRNHHRLTAERDGELLHENILIDSPLRTSVRHAVATLQAEGPPPVPDLAPLRRIAAMADLLRAAQPHPSRAAITSAVAVNQ